MKTRGRERQCACVLEKEREREREREIEQSITVGDLLINVLRGTFS